MALSHAMLMLTIILTLTALFSGQAPAMAPSTTMTPPPMMMTPMMAPPMMSPAMSPGPTTSPPAPMGPMGSMAPTPSMVGMPPVTSTQGSAAFKHDGSLAMLALLGAAAVLLI